MNEKASGPVAYSDGGCVGNPGPGGWGVHVEYPNGRVVELGGGEDATTNNRMELRAAIEAVRAIRDWPGAVIVTDSQYVLRGITEWIAGWKRRNWVTSGGQPVLNRDLWEELDGLDAARLAWRWTKGHAGTAGNERCDQIATWFANSVRPLADGGPARQLSDKSDGRSGRSDGRSAGTPLARQRAAAKPPPAGTLYLSLVDGIPARHATWSECEQRVRGVKSARFKKVRGPAEERDVFAAWGVTADDLFGI